jgi:L-ascorbate metabolism protein UlaG (beta-lactamase superfamily)
MVDGAAAARLRDTGADRIGFLGHATVLIELEGVRLLTDPLLRGRVAHLRRQAPVPREELFADLDAVLISHLHHDHLDLASLRRLGRDTPLIVPRGAGPWLEEHRFVTVTELSVGEVAQVGTLAVRAVHADHDTRRPGGPHVDAVGYLVKGAHEVYFAGDTAFYPGMADLAGSLEVALVPVAGWGPKLGPGHMGPLEAAEAVASMRPRLAIPVHWGTLLPIGLGHRHGKRLTEPPRLFAEQVARLAPSVEVRIVNPGQETVL